MSDESFVVSDSPTAVLCFSGAFEGAFKMEETLMTLMYLVQNTFTFGAWFAKLFL